MKSSIAHKIKHREVSNNEFYIPNDLAKKLIDLVPLEKTDIVCDNAYGTGVFYKNFPEFLYIKQYCTKEKDFLQWKTKQSWFITNPPYSNLDQWLEHSCKFATKGFAYLLGLHNLTPRRIEMCEKYGYCKSEKNGKYFELLEGDVNLSKNFKNEKEKKGWENNLATPVKNYKKNKNNNKSNLITLCLKCHLKRHQK